MNSDWNDVVNAASSKVGQLDEGSVLVLPTRIENGCGLYRPRDLVVPKELRYLGVEAYFAHEDDDRRALSEHSTVELVAFAIGLAGNISWDAAKELGTYLVARTAQLTGGRRGQIELHIAKMTHPDGRVLDDVKVSGPATDETLERIVSAIAGPADEH